MCLFITTAAAAQSSAAQPHCTPVGGSLMTNFVDQDTTLGTVTGDLAGAVSATLLGVTQEPAGAFVFSVLHQWVTTTGDTIMVDPAQATASPVREGLFGVVSYPVTISGGTGRFQGARGTLQSIGEVDLNTQRTVFRYQGTICFPAHVR
jgi:hypothetical protein